MNAQATQHAPTPTLPQWQPPTPPARAAKPLPTAAILQAAAGALTVLALALSTDGQESWYSSTPAWSVFATVAAIVQLVPLVGRSTEWPAERSWTIGAAGAAGLSAWWILIALPAVSSNQGFAATLAIAAAVLGSWLTPGRRL
jgi:hypothetical protein